MGFDGDDASTINGGHGLVTMMMYMTQTSEGQGQLVIFYFKRESRK